VVSAPVATPSARAAGRSRGSSLLRLGAVAYLNAAPLVEGLEADAGVHVERDVPARVAERLRAGEVDLGMIPAIAYAGAGDAIVPGIAIGSRGPVRSVLLFHAGPVEAVRRVALDASSLTSAALLRVLLRERLGRDPEYASLPPSLPRMLEAADAALLIGDPALDDASTLPRLDLGEEWTRLTGLPFVYAFWAGPAGAVSPAEVRRLQSVLAAGIAAIPEIARRHAAGDPARAARYESYLRTSVVYGLGEEERAGLVEFYRRAHALGLIPAVPELRFHADR
jgi:chorismate dehydratase